ncbi:MAG TPA: cytochrome D1 domain-containing protein, partial [Acidobacteriota bacterium]|nr:cytochrome D1 domain-containing protein [Acidobacteriota bacterium]
MPARISLFIFLLFSLLLPSLYTQEAPPITIRPTPTEDIILAIADIQPLGSDPGGGLADAVKTFNQVLWDDLDFSGFFTLAGRSFYPPQPIVRPEVDIDFKAWDALPFKVSMLTTGTLTFVSRGVVRAELSVFDMKQRERSFRKRYTGDIGQIRQIAHYWADEIVFQLTAGSSRGVASTKIAYVSEQGDAKEIHIMDYDGHNQTAFTHNRSLNLFPAWAPDNSKLAFVSFRPKFPEINIYSYIDGSRIPFPIFNSYVNTPAFSPDGKEIAFALRTPRGDSDIFISRLDGSNRRNITNNPAIHVSPAWSPSGRQIAYVAGAPGQIHIADVDGSNVRRIVREGGDADSVAWSPDGRWIAFHWKPRQSRHYDIFV